MRPTNHRRVIAAAFLPFLCLAPLAVLFAQQKPEGPRVAPQSAEKYRTAPADKTPQPSDRQPPATSDKTYMKVAFDKTFQEIFEADRADRKKFNQRQKKLLEDRYDLSDQPSDVWMSGQRKKVQQGVRIKLPDGVTWQELGEMTSEEIKEAQAFPAGFRPLPHAKHTTGGQVFPKQQIDVIKRLEQRELERFDIDFDLPQHLTPEFPPPIFLTNRPELGDISQGQVLSIKNYFELLNGKITPVQMEGMRLLLTPFPQQQFNQTDDRRPSSRNLVCRASTATPMGTPMPRFI